MRKNKLILGLAGFAAFAIAGIGLSGSADAASITMTGPGSTNVIYSSHGSSDSSIYFTGPGSTNLIGGYGNYHKYNHGKDNDRCRYDNTGYHGWYMMKSNYSKKDYGYKDKNCHYKNVSYKKHDDKCDDNDNKKRHSYIKTKKHDYKKNYKKLSYYKKDNNKYDHKKNYKHSDKKKYDHRDDDKKNYKKQAYKKYDRKDNHKDRFGKDYIYSRHSGFNYRVENNNNISISNNVSQYARSGDAIVRGNTIGGSAYSGDAMNTSNVDISVSIRN